jgi:hypothetical protein
VVGTYNVFMTIRAAHAEAAGEAGADVPIAAGSGAMQAGE